MVLNIDGEWIKSKKLGVLSGCHRTCPHSLSPCTPPYSPTPQPLIPQPPPCYSPFSSGSSSHPMVLSIPLLSFSYTYHQFQSSIQPLCKNTSICFLMTFAWLCTLSLLWGKVNVKLRIGWGWGLTLFRWWSCPMSRSWRGCAWRLAKIHIRSWGFTGSLFWACGLCLLTQWCSHSFSFFTSALLWSQNEFLAITALSWLRANTLQR